MSLEPSVCWIQVSASCGAAALCGALPPRWIFNHMTAHSHRVLDVRLVFLLTAVSDTHLSAVFHASSTRRAIARLLLLEEERSGQEQGQSGIADGTLGQQAPSSTCVLFQAQPFHLRLTADYRYRRPLRYINLKTSENYAGRQSSGGRV